MRACRTLTAVFLSGTICTLAKFLKVDDLDRSISYNGCFPNNPSRPCPGCGQNPDRSNFYQLGWADCSNGASMVVTFTGVSIDFFGSSPKNEHDFVPLRISVDGGRPHTFTPQFFDPQRFQYRLGYVEDLPQGPHTVTMEFFNQGAPGATLFDYYMYDDGLDDPTQIDPHSERPSSIDSSETQHSTVQEKSLTPSSHALQPSATSSMLTEAYLTVTVSSDGGPIQTVTQIREVLSTSDSPAPTNRDTQAPASALAGSKVHTGAIAGGVVSCILALAILLGFCCWRTRQKRSMSYQNYGTLSGSLNSHKSIRTPPLNRPPSYPLNAGFTGPPELAHSRASMGTHNRKPPGGVATPSYTHADYNAESSQLAAFVSANSDVITPELAERLQITRYRPEYDPDITSLAHWWEWFKVTPFEVGLLRSLYQLSQDSPPGNLPGATDSSGDRGSSVGVVQDSEVTSSIRADRYSKSVDERTPYVHRAFIS